MTALTAERALGSAERALVERAAAGDHDAFDLLAGPRLVAAMRTAMAILQVEADARDAVQEALVSAWRELPRLREPDHFDAWLGRILVNRCRSALRHRKRVNVREIALDTGERGIDDDPPRAAYRPAGVEGAQAEFAERDVIRRAFDRLNADARALIVLHYVEERPLAEIAAIAGVPEGTVKWRLHRARKALERALERERR